MKLKVLKKKGKQTGFVVNHPPKFQGWMRGDFLKAGIPEIDVMTCKEFDPKYIKKYPGKWIAQLKLDGHRAVCIVTPEGNRFFSRRISKVTGWYSENTDCVPHLRDLKLPGVPMGTIFDGELLFEWDCTSKDVQSVTGALPQKAIDYQMENGFLHYNIFDMISFGDNPMEEPYDERLVFLNDFKFPKGFQIVPTYEWKPEYGENFRGLLEQLWEEGKEGLVLKNLESTYTQGKRSPHWLKLKECKTFDVIITGFQEPTKVYDGKDPERWQFWENLKTRQLVKSIGNPAKSISNEAEKTFVPVTKPYFFGWIGAIEYGLYDVERDKIVKIGEAKGITDADQEYIMKNQKELIGTVIEVKAQGIIDPKTNSLRHPRFKQFRPDKDALMCTWNGFGE